MHSPASDPRSPLPVSATSVGVRHGALALTVDTSFADEYRLAVSGKDSLIANEFRRREADLDEIIDALEKGVGIGPALPSSGVLPSEELDRVRASAPIRGQSNSIFAPSSGSTKGDSWRNCSPDESAFGAWPEKKPKKQLHIFIPKPDTGDLHDALPHSCDITDCNPDDPHFTTPLRKGKLRICNPDPTSSESSAVIGAKESHCTVAPESPFVDKIRPSSLFSQKVQDDLQKYEITYSRARRAPDEELSPRSVPKKALARRPTVLQPRARHSCYACQMKKEMGQKAKVMVNEGKKGKVGL